MSDTKQERIEKLKSLLSGFQNLDRKKHGIPQDSKIVEKEIQSLKEEIEKLEKLSDSDPIPPSSADYIREKMTLTDEKDVGSGLKIQIFRKK